MLDSKYVITVVDLIDNVLSNEIVLCNSEIKAYEVALKRVYGPISLPLYSSIDELKDLALDSDHLIGAIHVGK